MLGCVVGRGDYESQRRCQAQLDFREGFLEGVMPQAASESCILPLYVQEPEAQEGLASGGSLEGTRLSGALSGTAASSKLQKTIKSGLLPPTSCVEMSEWLCLSEPQGPHL